MAKLDSYNLTLQNAASATDAGAVMDVAGLSAVIAQVSGTFTTISLAWQATVDGSNWVGVFAQNLNSGVNSLTAIATGLYGLNVAGFVGLRANLTWTTGTSVTVKAHGIAGGLFLPPNAPGGSATILAQQGAANLATAQVAASTSAGTLAIARATRRSITIKNTDAAITVYYGPATVTAGNGFPLKAGESISVTWVGLIQVIAASGTPSVAIADEWD